MERLAELCTIEHAHRVYFRGYLRAGSHILPAASAAQAALRKTEATELRELDWQFSWQRPKPASSAPCQLPALTSDEIVRPFDITAEWNETGDMSRSLPIATASAGHEAYQEQGEHLNHGVHYQGLALEANIMALALDKDVLECMNSCMRKLVEDPHGSSIHGEDVDLVWLQKVIAQLDAMFSLWHRNACETLRALEKQLSARQNRLPDLLDYASPLPSRTHNKVKAAHLVKHILSRPIGSAPSGAPDCEDIVGDSSSSFVRPMDIYLEHKIKRRQQESIEWRELQEDWCALFCQIAERLQKISSRQSLDAAAGNAERECPPMVPGFPDDITEVYSERAVYSDIYLLELLREACGQLIEDEHNVQSACKAHED
ncbi:hypothetical protein BCV69DRAFT_279393 [Microstroma glucosiphilum]|uniref:Uncharacterized protein n=1 Tax=Pseudomicrostroma glucosiphilum TaxID=1684307 RepID=A0A316TZB7_9BASI|nr:hypothetical protein BCV69DRAFT_279393 [Pseudomicrostroma glucosiphilum]PWN17671.1 hypothetical protein BCV69DRAFT_279393 [Pseudomicrostroma glucosiphilum]